MLSGKVAVVTGGTRGIGYAIVKKFLDNGARVVLLGSRKDTVDDAILKLKQLDDRYEVIGFWPVLHREDDVNDCFSEVAKEFGKIDILVNNAGISSNTKIEDYTEDEYDSIANLNIKGVFVCCKVAVPYLKETKGIILNTSSMVSIHGQASGVMYPTSKFAINGLTKSLSRELAPFSIRVNAVAPGVIETDMVKDLPKQVIDPLVASIPLGRIGKVDDVANAFLFLASDMATYITGEILQVDGGARF